MSQKETKRSYNMSKRAEAAAETERAIFEAAGELWRKHPFADITLDAIAERAGVSARTVIRRYGSKEGVFEAGIQNGASNANVKRDLAEPGDINDILDYLLEDYETYGDAMIRTLAVEEQLSAAKKVIQAGRITHRQWCAKMFAPFLPEAASKDYEHRLLSFVAATDLYLWKLLRRDLNADQSTTRQAYLNLVTGLVNSNSTP